MSTPEQKAIALASLIPSEQRDLVIASLLALPKQQPKGGKR